MTKKRDRSRVLIAFIISFAIFYVRIKTNGAGSIIILEDMATHEQNLRTIIIIIIQVPLRTRR